jgi:site-specific recombinase XerD
MSYSGKLRKSRLPASLPGIFETHKRWLESFSYAVELYRQERDVRAVQKQRGHSSIQTTQRYADVTEQDLQDQIKKLWN